MSQTETKKTVHTFAAASFLNDFGSDMIYPIWPTFVKDILLADMLTLGFIDGLGDAIVSISQAASGYLSDRTRKRKIFVWTGYFFGSASRVGYAASTAWQHLVPFRILDRAGKMRGAPRDAIIADASTNANRGRNFGLLRAMDNLGAVCGIITCLLLFGLLGYQTLFLIAAVPSVIGALMIMTIIKEKKPAESKIYKGMSLRALDMNLKLFITLSAIFAFGSFSYSFLLLFAKESGFEAGATPILYLLFTAVAFLFSLPFGKLSDTVGRKTVLLLSYGLWGLVSVVFILSQNLLAIILSFFLYGLHRGALDTVQKAFVAELAPIDYRASTLGGFQMVVGLCALPSSLLAGLLWETYNQFTPFYLSLVLTAVSIAMLLLVREKRA
ncbi:MAG: MFS transporter [Candidatus Bathyarchaeota archaeon]|nr:MFS transporter [Candidatus Bathyarchaeota archaeon]